MVNEVKLQTSELLCFPVSPPEGPEIEGCPTVLGGVSGRQRLPLLLPRRQLLQGAEETLHTQGEGQAARPIRERYGVILLRVVQFQFNSILFI